MSAGIQGGQEGVNRGGLVSRAVGYRPSAHAAPPLPAFLQAPAERRAWRVMLRQLHLIAQIDPGAARCAPPPTPCAGVTASDAAEEASSAPPGAPRSELADPQQGGIRLYFRRRRNKCDIQVATSHRSPECGCSAHQSGSIKEGSEEIPTFY